MREIKFRAWNVLESKMEYGVYPLGESLILKHERDPERERIELTEYVEEPSEEWWEIMQYTGLKDKNGKDIYEGDCVTNKLYKSENVAFECYFDEKEGMFKQRPFIFKKDGRKRVIKGLSMQMNSVQNKEIIGNVYEHPELVES